MVAMQAQEGPEELSHIEGQEGGGKEIPLIQGKEQGLCFAGAALKRYSMSKVRETPIRQQALREGIRGQTDCNHNTEN